MKKLFIFCFLFSCYRSYSQSQNSASELLNKFWKIECLSCSNENYYNFYKNKIFHLEFSNNKIVGITTDSFVLLKDGFGEIIEKTDYSESFLLKLIKEKRNDLFTFDSVFYSSSTSVNINFDIVIFDEKASYYANIANCNFVSIDWFSMYYYGRGGQPQNGYQYKVVEKLPHAVLEYFKGIRNNDLRKITAVRSNIYSEPNQITKMYLVKDDSVEILEKLGEWVKIRFFGKKIVEGWIKRNDINF